MGCIGLKKSSSSEYNTMYKNNLAKLYTTKPTLQDFTKIKLLGSGAYGNVFLIKHTAISDLYFAMKVISLKRLKNKKQKRNVANERKILAQLDNPFLANLRLAFKDNESLYLITDFAQGGELFYHMKKEIRFSEDKVKFYCAEIIIALEYLHSKKIIYRDLKPENILLDHEGHIILTDFGLSKIGEDEGKTLCGTLNYLAPEIIDGQTYTNAVDWWSLGCLAYEMLTGKQAYNIKSINKNAYNDKPVFYSYLSNDVSNFLCCMMNHDPSIRTRKNPREHKFFRGVDWITLEKRNFPTPLVPEVTSREDVSYFDPQFTSQDPNNLGYDSTIPANYNDKEENNNDNDSEIEDDFKGFDFININMNGNNNSDDS